MSASLPLRLATPALCVLLLAPGAARSESDPLTRAELMEMLKARDAIIIELQQRVRRLERLVEGGNAKAEKPDKGTTARPKTAPSPRGAAEPAARERASAREPGQLEVDEDAAARALERTLVREGTLLLPAGVAEVQPSFVYEFNDDDFPSLASVGGGTRAVSNTVERSRYEGRVDLRFGMPLGAQLELGLPYRVVNVEREAAVGGASAGEIATTGSGFGDFEVGAAATFVREGPWWPDVVGRTTWNTGTGEKRSDGVGLGGGFQSLSGSLSFTKRQDPLAFFGSLGYEAVFEDGNVDPGDEYFARLGTALAASPDTSLLFFVDHRFSRESEVGGREIDGSDATQVTFNVGASTLVMRDTLLNVTAGIGITEDAPDYSIGVSLPLRFGLPEP